MKQVAVAFFVLAVFFGVAAGAQSPRPHATPSTPAAVRKIKVNSLANPAGRANPHTMTGADCSSGTMANRAAQTVNPITGQPQAAPLVEVPLTKGGGSVADATRRAQQAAACAHPAH